VECLALGHEIGCGLKVALITLGIYPTQTGGVQIHSYYHVMGLSQAGDEVVVLTRKLKGVPSSIKVGSTNVECLGSGTPVLGVITFVVEAFLMLVRQRKNIDLVHVHYATYFMLPAFFFHLLTSKPYVVSCHGFDIVYLRRSLGWRILQGTIFRAAAAVTCTSSQVHDLLVTEYHLPAAKVRTIHNGIDESEIARAKLGKSPMTGKHVAFVANLRPVKDPLTAIEAVHIASDKIPDLSLVMVGGGPLLGPLREFVGRNNLQNVVDLKGELTHDEALGTMAECDAFLLSSLSEGGNSLALTEAMALEKPVISTNVGGVNDLIRDGINGFLVPIKSPGPMAERIVAVLRDPQLAARLAANAAQTARLYTWTKTIAAYRDIYDSLLNR
jgi:glycosyltransferase involved in cell wall biosynthesis